MITNQKLYFLLRDANFHLWSHVIQFLKTVWDFSFLDIFKMSIFHFSKKVLRKKTKNIKGIYYIILILKEKIYVN
jgi:hypothetical protein